MSLRFAKKDLPQLWRFLQPYLQSQREYDVRFGVVMLMRFFAAQADYLEDVLHTIDRIGHEGYYANMAMAWALCECYIKYPAQVKAYLSGCALNDFTYRKTLQKISESLRVTKEEKQNLRAMKRS